MPDPPSNSALILPFPGARERARKDASYLLEREITTLFDELHHPLMRYLLSIGLPVSDAEEIVQDAFLALFHHLQANKPRLNLQGWVFRVAHNLGLKRRTRNAVELSRQCESPVDPTPSAEQLLLTKQRQARLQATLRKLPEQDQFCLHLRSEGLRYREIAKVLGISLGGVALSVQRSLARLRKAEEGEA